MKGSSLIKSVLLSFYHFSIRVCEGWLSLLGTNFTVVLDIGKSSLTVKVEEWIIESSRVCLVLGCRPIFRRVIALLNSITAVKIHDTLVRV